MMNFYKLSAVALAAITLQACTPQAQAPKTGYEISGQVRSVKQYPHKETLSNQTNYFWGADIKVFEEKPVGATASAPFAHYGTLRRYKVSETDAARLKRGMKIKAVEETTNEQQNDYFHREYLTDIEIQ